MIRQNKIAVGVCILFFIAYSVLCLVRHNHFGSYGFDLGISDQIVWEYSHLQTPITTIQAFPFTSILTDHVELIYILFAPFYWIYSSPITLLFLQTFFVCFSGLPMYLLARKKGINQFLSISLLISYLLFYGVQNALWFDIHSLAFGSAFLAWFIYFLDTKNLLWTMITVILAIICKEDIALLTGAISFVYLIKRRDRLSLALLLVSAAYLLSIFFLYFPHFTHDGYRYREEKSIQLAYLFDTPDKRNTILYSFAWFGFIPLLAPFYLLPVLADLGHYFIFAHSLRAAQGLFLHYRISLAPLFTFPSIIAISHFRKLNNKYTALYLLILAMTFQYHFHLPLSYVTKRWFWTEPKSVKNINAMIAALPSSASVVAQNNITPHISHRKLIFTLYPTTKDFTNSSPCGQKICNWLRWSGDPNYLVVDTSRDWDERSFLVKRESFIDAIGNLEKSGDIKLYKQQQDAYLYEINRKPI